MPSDSALTPGQIEQYLRTTAAQLAIIRAEAPVARERMAAARGDRKAAAPGAKRPKSPQAIWGDFVDAAYVRSARKLGYNPAELWYVRHRMSLAGGHLVAGQLQGSKHQVAGLFRQQAEAMRSTPGVAQAQIDAMIHAAEQAERQQPPRSAPPRLAQNLDALRRARGGLSEATWSRIASVAAGTGLSDLGTIPEAHAARRLDELTRLFGEALAGRDVAAR